MLNDAALVLAANAVDAAITHLSLHTTGALTSSANESTAGRVASSATVDGDGDLTWPSTSFTGGAAGGPVTRVGYWSAATGGTFYGSSALVGDNSFNAAGEYTVTSITETTTAT